MKTLTEILWKCLCRGSKSYVLTILLFLTSSAILQSQTNHVPNSSFEDWDFCPTQEDELGFAKNWFKPTSASTDFHHACGVTPNRQTNINPTGVDKNLFGYQVPHKLTANSEANGYGGIAIEYNGQGQPEYREYLSVQLSTPLYANVHYKMAIRVSRAEFYYRHAGAIKKLGAYFSTNNPSVSGTYTQSLSRAPYNYQPQIVFQPAYGGFIDDFDDWMLLVGDFTPSTTMNYVTIGNFQSSIPTNEWRIKSSATDPDHQPTSSDNWYGAYYYVDDVEIFGNAQLGPCICNNAYQIILKPKANYGSARCCYDLTIRKNNINACDLYGFAIQTSVNGTVNYDAQYSSDLNNPILVNNQTLPDPGYTLPVCVNSFWDTETLTFYFYTNPVTNNSEDIPPNPTCSTTVSIPSCRGGACCLGLWLATTQYTTGFNHTPPQCCYQLNVRQTEEGCGIHGYKIYRGVNPGRVNPIHEVVYSTTELFPDRGPTHIISPVYCIDEGDTANYTVDFIGQDGKVMCSQIYNVHCDEIVPFGRRGEPTSSNILSTKDELSLLPNPIGNEGQIEYLLMAEGFVKIDVCDQTGRVLVPLTSVYRKPGKYAIDYKPENLSAGLYFLRMVRDDVITVIPMLIER